jgi:hypothetical protein
VSSFEENSSTQCRADARQVVPAVPERVILNDELRGDRRAEAQREGRRLIQLVIREWFRATTYGASNFVSGGGLWLHISSPFIILGFWSTSDSLLPLCRRNYYAAANFVDDSGAADSVRLVAAE